MNWLYNVLGIEKWESVEKIYCEVEIEHLVLGISVGKFKEWGILSIERNKYNGAERASFTTANNKSISVNPDVARAQLKLATHKGDCHD